MTRLEYRLEYPNFTDCTYQILQIRKGEPYQFFSKDILIGSIEKVNSKWEQTSGRQTLDAIVESMGIFIEKNT